MRLLYGNHMTRCLYNFAPGPAMLPLSVLKRIERELLDFCGMGWSILEASRCSKEVQAILNGLREKIRALMQIPESRDILFCQGGGRTQFAMVPMNLLGASPVASYIVMGTWSRAAAKEMTRFARGQTAFVSNGVRVPRANELSDILPERAFCYFCDNKTMHEVEFSDPPTLPKEIAPHVPPVADMTNNFMSRPVDASRFGLFWAGARDRGPCNRRDPQGFPRARKLRRAVAVELRRLFENRKRAQYGFGLPAFRCRSHGRLDPRRRRPCGENDRALERSGIVYRA